MIIDKQFYCICCAASVGFVITLFAGCSDNRVATSQRLEDAGAISQAPPIDAEMQAVINCSNSLAFKMYRELDTDSQANMVLSPYSIWSSLAMIYTGASGVTSDQMRDVLGISISKDKFDSAVRRMNDAIKASTGGVGSEFAFANSLWIKKNFRINNSYSSLLKESYGCTVNETDFNGDPAASRELINRWISHQTRGKISDLLSPSQVTSSTTLAMVNGMYFRGKWDRPFDGSNTKPGNFETAPSHFIHVPMMFMANAPGRYAETREWNAAELSYSSGRITMLLMYPVKRSKLREAGATLSLESFAIIRSRLEKDKQTIVIPKFSVNHNCDLVSHLKMIGLTLPFGDKATFDGIGPSPRLRFSSFAHGASIEIDEVGTVATAASSANGVLVKSTTPFRIDQPFLAILMDTYTGTILSFARITRP